jgi:cell volume regulation protein A
MFDFNWILLALSVVVLASYLFDFLARRSRIPSVVMLIATGIGVQVGFDLIGWKIAFVGTLLPILGTLGLVLIVLEGALELRLTMAAKTIILRSAALAFLGIAIAASVIAVAIHAYFAVPWLQAWAVATPFAIISSAVAIPAAQVLKPDDRDFVVYESALSDIFGVLFFYALIDSKSGVTMAVLNIVGGVGLSTVIGAVFGLLIVILIQRIEAHVRFIPMIFGLVLIYAGSKILHLAPLVTVFAVGLLLNNLPAVQLLPGLHALQPAKLENDLKTFKHLTSEFTFIVRTFFFVLLGYSTSLPELLHPLAWLISGLILSVAFAGRALLLRVLAGPDIHPLIWFAPRGLISVLLYLNIPPHLRIAGFPDGALMLTVLGSILIMTFGSIVDAKKSAEAEAEAESGAESGAESEAESRAESEAESGAAESVPEEPAPDDSVVGKQYQGSKAEKRLAARWGE